MRSATVSSDILCNRTRRRRRLISVRPSALEGVAAGKTILYLTEDLFFQPSRLSIKACSKCLLLQWSTSGGEVFVRCAEHSISRYSFKAPAEIFSPAQFTRGSHTRTMYGLLIDRSAKVVQGDEQGPRVRGYHPENRSTCSHRA